MQPISRQLPVIALLTLLFQPAGLAQWVPSSQWEETTIIVGSEVQEVGGNAPTETRVIEATELPGPLQYEEVAAKSQIILNATFTVRALHRREPWIIPNTEERVGAATLIRGEDNELLLITATTLVGGAESVVIELDGRRIDTAVEVDVRYGLAVLTPAEEISHLRTPLELGEADANTTVEAFSAGVGDIGATMGAGADFYAFYQINSLGVSLGYSIIDREGELVGIGSHIYPLEPSLSLSIPSSSVRTFLSVRGEQ